MAFSELQYSNKKSIASGETWTKEDNILDLSMADNINILFFSFSAQTEISQKFVLSTFSVPRSLFNGKTFTK